MPSKPRFPTPAKILLATARNLGWLKAECCPESAKYTFVLKAGTIFPFPHDVAGLAASGGRPVIGKEYLVRQAAILLKFAEITTDPKVAAGLLDKAADLKSKVDETARPDPNPIPPDVERPA